MRHVTVMAGTGAVGLIAVFAVDLINLFYISLLGQKEIAAAVGFAGVVGFFHVSVAIGLTIGIAAVVARAIGGGRTADARRLATASLTLMVVVTAVVGSGTALLLGPVLQALGASGDVAQLAHRYLAVTVHSLPLLGLGMACAALLRAVGDARRAMVVTLAAALVTAVLDPILIFGFKLGLDGAAIASVVSRVALAAVGLHGVAVRHQMLSRLDVSRLQADARTLMAVAAPAILTNLATPVAAAFVTHSMAQFGPSAVAGAAIIDRLSPVAFGVIYALSGAVGPILSQNLGAGRVDRVRAGLRASLVFMACAVALAWAMLALAVVPWAGGQGLLIRMFSADAAAAELIALFCLGLAPSFFFIGALFVANAAFNNLGYPLLSTAFNWGRATLGTIPFAWWGSHYSASGVLIGQSVGSAIFGVLAIVVAWRIVGQLEGGVPQASVEEGLMANTASNPSPSRGLKKG
jgi:putative MATE family efflux protein